MISCISVVHSITAMFSISVHIIGEFHAIEYIVLFLHWYKRNILHVPGCYTMPNVLRKELIKTNCLIQVFSLVKSHNFTDNV